MPQRNIPGFLGGLAVIWLAAFSFLSLGGCESRDAWQEVDLFRSVPGPSPTLLPVEIAPVSQRGLSIQLGTATAIAGQALDLSISVLRGDGTRITDFSGTVHITASDPSAEFPKELQFTAAHQGSISLPRAVLFRKTGLQSLTVSAEEAGFSPLSAQVTVSHAPAAKFVLFAPSRSSVGYPAAVTIQVQDAFDNLATGFESAVTLMLSGSGTGSGRVEIVQGEGRRIINDVKAETINLAVTDSERTGLDATASAQIAFVGGAPVSIALSGPSRLLPAQCGVITLNLKDAFGNATGVSAQSDVSLFQNGNARFYGTLDCSGPAITSLVLQEGTGTRSFSMQDAKEEGVELRARLEPLPAATLLLPVMNPRPSDVATLAAGGSHTCGIKDGGVQCWGANSQGQLGTGSGIPTFTTVPVWVSGLGAGSGVLSISAGANHTCAILNGGQLKCWGDNGYGQLGNNSTFRQYAPVLVTGFDAGVTEVSAGESSTCAIKSGSAFCWGNAAEGRLGDGVVPDPCAAIVYSPTPQQVKGLTSGVTSITVWSHACAIQDSAVKCWGSNSTGQLGQLIVSDTSVPSIALNVADAIKVAVSSGTTCAFLGDRVKCWGSNDGGQLGSGSGNTGARPSPQDVAGLTSGVSMLSGGASHFCAVQYGVLKCWGHNEFGQLGDGTLVNKPGPVTVSSLANIGWIGAGATHSCALVGSSWKCWGGNASGQLGNGTTANSTSPVPVSTAP